MRYIVEHGQITGSRQKISCCGYSAASRCTRLISVPIAKVEPAGAAWMAFTMKSVEPAASAASTTGIGHSGCTMTCTPGCEARAAAICSTVKRLCTEQNPCHRMTLASSSAAALLVGEEEHPLSALERPLEHRLRVRRRAHDAAMASDESLQRGRRVHVGDRNHRHPAVGVGHGQVSVDLG